MHLFEVKIVRVFFWLKIRLIWLIGLIIRTVWPFKCDGIWTLS